MNNFETTYLIERLSVGAEPMQLEIYNGAVEDRENVFCVRRFEGLPAEILPELKKELPRWSGQMTAFYKRRGRAEKTAEQIPFFAGGSSPGHSSTRAEIRAEVERELNEQRRTQEVEDLKSELERIKQPAGHLAVIVEAIVARFISVPGAATPALNGPGADVDDLQYFEAVEVLTQKFGRDILIKLAVRIKKEPQLIELVKNFIA